MQIAGPIRAAGDGGLIVRLAHATGDPAVMRAATEAVEAALSQSLGDGLIDLVPAHDTLLVLFDPLAATPATVRRTIRSALAEVGSGGHVSPRRVVLPVYYGADVGPDLDELAAHAGLSVADVIAIHQQGEYTVQAIGFAPGFAYLGTLDERLAMPRLATPRTRVPAGSVAVAQRQTAVYPAVSPGGWRIIGRCPLRLFDPNAQPPSPYTVGDVVEFTAVDREQFVALGGLLGGLLDGSLQP